jgi:transmembrane sensor
MVDERTSREAIDWLIRLQEEPGDKALLRRFETWRGADAAHAAAWAEIAQTDALIAAAGAKPRAGTGTYRFAAGLGLAIAASIALLSFSGLPLRLCADYATATGQWRTVRLADGSAVELGPQSALDVDLSASGRHVKLLAGRAFFEVAHDPAKPFTVDAHGVRTTVLGTGFDVALDAADAAVAVEHGTVQVDSAATSSRRLQAGDWVRIAWNGEAVDGSEAPGEVGAWRDGRLVVHDQSVASVVETLRTSYEGFILVRDGALAAKRVTGVYDLRNPAAALQALAEAHGGRVYRLTPWLMVLADG